MIREKEQIFQFYAFFFTKKSMMEDSQHPYRLADQRLNSAECHTATATVTCFTPSVTRCFPCFTFPDERAAFGSIRKNQFSSTKPRKKWIIPAHGSSRYVKFLLFGRVLLVNRHNFYTWKIQVYLSHFSNTVVPYCWLPRFMFDCCTNGDSQVVSIDLNHVCLIARVNLIKVGGMIFWPPPISTQRKTHDCMTKGAILRKDKSNPRLSNWIT